MNELRKYFAKRKEKIPAVACGDAEWRSAAWSLPCRWIIGIWGGEKCLSGGQVGERSALMGSARLYPCYVLLPAKVRNGNFERGCKGKSTRRSQV